MMSGERRSAWGVFVVGLGTLVVPSDSSVNVAFPAITAFFHLPIADIRWIAIVYMLAQTSLMLVFGRIGDMAGYRRLFLIGLAVSGLGLFGCAIATSYAFLLSARGVQGIGAGLVLSCGPALAISQQPEAVRARVLGVYTMLYSAGFVLGPAVAGPLIQYFGWRGVYWFRVPLALVAFLASWTLPTSEPPASVQRLDLAGAALLVVGLTLALLGLDRLQVAAVAPVWPIGFGVLAVMALWAFVRQERRVPQPIIAMQYFARPELALGVLVSVFINLACFGILLLLPFHLARVGKFAPPIIGAVLASAAVGMVLASPLAGLLARRVGSWTLAIAGCVAMAAGLGRRGRDAGPCRIDSGVTGPGLRPRAVPGGFSRHRHHRSAGGCEGRRGESWHAVPYGGRRRRGVGADAGVSGVPIQRLRPGVPQHDAIRRHACRHRRDSALAHAATSRLRQSAA